MTSNTAPQIQCKTASEVRLVSVSFSGKLDENELLTGTPTVTDATGDLTLNNKAVNTAALKINRATVPVGEAVQFSVAGGTAGEQYIINILCSTDSSPAETLEQNVILEVT